jgi:hypothetical protein
MKKRCYEFDVLLAEARVDQQLIANLNAHPPGVGQSAEAHALIDKTARKLEAVSDISVL